MNRFEQVSAKADDCKAYFWQLLGRVQICLDLIAEGRLNFVLIEFDVHRIGDEGTSELLDMMTELSDY